MSREHGRCLCGAISVEVEAIKESLGVCHCTMCRTWGGGPFLAVECGTAVKFSDESKVGRYRSSEWAERGFCKQCGTHLFYCYLQDNSYHIPAGIFPDLQATMTSQIFIDEKPNYYRFANETKMLTGEQLVALFNKGQE
ncbi:GFA family protein [Alteromonas pelagimontana]|uniref:GFA family protein n=1 Tax=Alteromonas pelagimontana TaxID=1858656 RepID=A0A6M4MD67_9ALTE|nr:GFA family protein [Alteromonas pelagimontana]QJR80957.1 GFA family protein [Alteromonas pelagimontana]